MPSECAMCAVSVLVTDGHDWEEGDLCYTCLASEHACLKQRTAALQSQLKEAKEGWDSAIADLYAAAEIAKGMQSQLAAKWISVDVSMPSEIDAEFWVWVRPNAGIRHDGSLIKADFSPHMRLCKTYQNRDGEVRFNCGALEEVTHYQRTPSPPPSGAKGETKP